MSDGSDVRSDDLLERVEEVAADLPAAAERLITLEAEVERLREAIHEAGKLAVLGVGKPDADCEDMLRAVLDITVTALRRSDITAHPSDANPS